MLDYGLNILFKHDRAHHYPYHQISTQYTNSSPSGTTIVHILEHSSLQVSLLVFGGHGGLNCIVYHFEVLGGTTPRKLRTGQTVGDYNPRTLTSSRS